MANQTTRRGREAPKGAIPFLTALCGHGHFDMRAYEMYLSGEMTDYDLPDSAIAAAMAKVPVMS